MKTRADNNSDLCHRWANNTDPNRAMRCGNLSFTGQKLYSYGHYLIGNKTGAVVNDNRTLVLLNEHKYSNTTARHISLADRALERGLYCVIYVPKVDVCASSHAYNVDYLLQSCTSMAGKAERARQNAPYYLETLNRLRLDLAVYCQAFGLAMPANVPDVDSATREKIMVRATEARIRQEEREKNANEKRKAEALEAFTAWRDNGGAYSWGFHIFPVALRVNNDQIETSKGASVPLRDGITAIKMFLAGKLSHGARIGEYTTISANADGVKIGCHDISKGEIERLAGILGLLGIK